MVLQEHVRILLLEAGQSGLVRTRMPGGVAGARLAAAPYADQEPRDEFIGGTVYRAHVLGHMPVSYRLRAIGEM